MVPALYFRIHKEFTQPRLFRLKNQFTSNLKISPLFIYTQSCLYPLLELGSLSWTLRGQRSAFQKIIFRCPRHSFRQEMISTCRAFFYLLITRQKKELFKRSLNRRNLKTPAAPAVWFSCRRKTELLFRKRWPYRDAIVFEKLSHSWVAAGLTLLT